MFVLSNMVLKYNLWPNWQGSKGNEFQGWKDYKGLERLGGLDV